jgi:hypothetical protein
MSTTAPTTTRLFLLPTEPAPCRSPAEVAIKRYRLVRVPRRSVVSTR